MLRFKSVNFPESNLITVYEINPMTMPLAIEKVKGIIMAVITTGADSLKSSHAMFLNKVLKSAMVSVLTVVLFYESWNFFLV